MGGVQSILLTVRMDREDRPAVREILGGMAGHSLAGLAEETAGASMVALTQCDISRTWQTPRSGCPALLPPCPPGVFQRKLNPHVSDLLTLITHLKVVLQEWFGPKKPGGTLIMIVIVHFEMQTCPLT